MDNYSVKLMSRALRDLDKIYDYISHTLVEPGTALKLVERIENAIFFLRDHALSLPGTKARRLCVPGVPAASCGELHRDLPHSRIRETGHRGDGPVFLQRILSKTE